MPPPLVLRAAILQYAAHAPLKRRNERASGSLRKCAGCPSVPRMRSWRLRSFAGPAGPLSYCSLINMLKATPVKMKINFHRLCKGVPMKIKVSRASVAITRTNRNREVALSTALPQTARRAQARNQLFISGRKQSPNHTYAVQVTSWRVESAPHLLPMERVRSFV